MTDQGTEFISRLISSNDFYGLEQILKSRISRLRSRRKGDEAFALLLEALDALSSAESPSTNSQLNLLDLLASVVGETPDLEIPVELVAPILAKIPFSKPKVGVATRLYKLSKDRTLLMDLYNECVEHREFALAQRIAISADVSVENVICLINKWVVELPDSEKDLLIARFILYLLILKKFNTAKELYEKVGGAEASRDSLLLESIGKLFISIERKNKEWFKALVESVPRTLQRDPELGKLFKKCGKVYLGVEDGAPDLFAMFESFLS